MQQIFSKEFMLENCGCYTNDELMKCSFMKSEEITLKSIFESEIRLKDKFWFLCRKLATKGENQQIAITVAELVLPIYESTYPENKAPREAIEAAKLFIAGHISLDELVIKRNAAHAAYTAAYAAAADTDDPYATYAAAAYAAYAAAADTDDPYATYAAAAYAAADLIKQQLTDYLYSFLK